MDAIECMWATLDGNSATVGRVVSGHDTEEAARLEADRIGGCYESADIIAAVQSGESYTDAVQRHAGRDRRPATVRVGVAPRVNLRRSMDLRFVAILSDLLMLALAEAGNVRAQMWLVVTREIKAIESVDYEWPDSPTDGEKEAFLDGMYQALCAIEEVL